MSDRELVEVTQADWDAVQAFHRDMVDKLLADIASGAPSTFGDDAGQDGDAIHQAFARHRIASEAAREAEVKALREANADAFNHGYLIAISTMLHQHDEPVVAEDALRDSGLTWGKVKKLGLDDFDLKVLRPVFKDMERKAALSNTGESA